tara:strand:+ start:19 stop:141 length:123 start_codon:yes stop_codon:yes gene_type:complete
VVVAVVVEILALITEILVVQVEEQVEVNQLQMLELEIHLL